MEKVFWEGGTLVAPVPPTMVSCGTMEESNILTIAWTGIINSNPPMTYISVRPERYSFDIIKKAGEFVINLPCENVVTACDWCGVKSGRDVDKFKEMGLTKVKGEKVDAPIIAQCPLNIECKVKDIVELGSHHMFIAEIVGVDVDKSLIDAEGKLHLDKGNLLAYAHGTYYTLGKSLGTFGFSVRKKPVKTKGKK
ncbi:MAG: flavin reductase family protein [Oscillospiraceae bacterium]